MFRFTLLSVLLGLLIYAGVEVGLTWGWFQRPSYEQEILIFLTAAHVGLYSVITRQLNQRPEDFVKVCLGTTVLRILFFGIFVFTIIRLDPARDTQNALLFLISYFLFTGLEVAAVFTTVDRQKPTNLGQKEG